MCALRQQWILGCKFCISAKSEIGVIRVKIYKSRVVPQWLAYPLAKKLLKLSLICLLISGSKEGKRPLTSSSTLASKSPKTLEDEGKVCLCMTEFITVSVLTIASTAIVKLFDLH